MRTYENIYGYSAMLPVDWLEVHPLFNGQEFDLAILGLKSYIQRLVFRHFYKYVLDKDLGFEDIQIFQFVFVILGHLRSCCNPHDTNVESIHRCDYVNLECIID